MDIVTIIGFTPWRKQNVLVWEPISLSSVILCLRGRLLILESSSHLSLFNFRPFSKAWPFYQTPLRLTDIIGLYTTVRKLLFLSVHSCSIPIVNALHDSKKKKKKQSQSILQFIESEYIVSLINWRGKKTLTLLWFWFCESRGNNLRGRVGTWGSLW